MKVKKVKLEWNVLHFDFNTNKIRTYNILTEELKEDIAKQVRKSNINALEDLECFVERYLSWKYRYRAEWEYVIGGLFTKEDDYIKCDVYDQAVINLKYIVDYINKEMDLKLK